MNTINKIKIRIGACLTVFGVKLFSKGLKGLIKNKYRFGLKLIRGEM